MKRVSVAFGIAALVATAGVASAAPLSGTFNLAGQAPVRVGPDYIDWGETGPVFGTPTGDIVFTSANGSFSGLTLTTGTLLDLTNPPALVGVPINIANFLTADTQPTWDFTLTFIEPGDGTPAGCTAAPGAVCTPPGSPFTIVNTAGNASVTLNMRGTVTDLVGPVSTWSAIYTTQFTGQSAASLLATIAGPQGYVQSSYSAEVTSTPPQSVPEPLSGFLLGTGLLVASTVLRRRS